MSELWKRAQEVLPGGVSSPVRSFRGVGGEPVFVASAAGPYLTTIDGAELIDLIGGYGPMILGHSHPEVVAAVQHAAARGQSFGAPTVEEVELGERIAAAVPSCEMVRLVSSGTEATMSALRLARAATGRQKVIKFSGCYHGHADAFLVAAGSGAATIGAPSSPGVPASVTQHTLVAAYNDAAGVAALFGEHGDDIAAVIVEPIAGNMGLVPPVEGFLETLRSLCTEHRSLLIFDEVMTGFRVAWGGAQTLLGVRPDLTTLGKVIGGGLPVGAYAGSRALMRLVAPAGDVYQAGTLSGNPLAVAAGLATLQILDREPDVYAQLEACGASLQRRLGAIASRHGLACRLQRCGSMLSLFLTATPVEDLAGVDSSDRETWTRLFHRLLQLGVHLPPSPYETWFLSVRHEEPVLATIAERFDQALAEIVQGQR